MSAPYTERSAFLAPARGRARYCAWAGTAALTGALALVVAIFQGRSTTTERLQTTVNAVTARATTVDAALTLTVGNEYGWWHNRMYPWKFVVEPQRTTDLRVQNVASDCALSFRLEHTIGTGVAAARDGSRNAARLSDAFTLVDTNATAGWAHAIFRLAAGEYNLAVTERARALPARARRTANFTLVCKYVRRELRALSRAQG